MLRIVTELPPDEIHGCGLLGNPGQTVALHNYLITTSSRGDSDTLDLFS